MPCATPELQREYARRWMAKRRADWFAGKVCEWCGTSERLELDHIDPELKVTHAVWSWAAHRREEELAKCRPLCHDCHQERTRIQARERMGGLDHGLTMYNKYGCRCDVCRAAKQAQDRKYRAKKKDVRQGA
jgi:hypothetical protein